MSIEDKTLRIRTSPVQESVAVVPGAVEDFHCCLLGADHGRAGRAQRGRPGHGAGQGLCQQPPAALIVTLAMAISSPGDGLQGGRPLVPHMGHMIASKSQIWDSCGSN